MIRKFILGVTVSTAIVMAGASAAFANSTGSTGQPNQSCEEHPSTPGNAATAPGSAFNPSGKAGTVYAGTQPQNSKNPRSVSQYDVACAKNGSH